MSDNTDVIEYDVTDQDHERNTADQAAFVTPKIGLYIFRLKSAEQGPAQSSGNPQVTVVYEIVGEPDGNGNWLEPTQNYGNLWDYVGLTPSTKWKLDQWRLALGVQSERGSLRLSDQVGKLVLGRVKHETYNGEARAKVASVWKWESPEDQAIAGIDVDEDEDEKSPAETEPVNPVFTDPLAGMGEADIDVLKKGGLKELADKLDIDIKGKKVGEVKQILKDELAKRTSPEPEVESEGDEDEDAFGF